ncbi:MAG TPA: DegT/DnrJ/EryC1/StrS family aminotransferase [Stellaceae bacterium]|nr:DegT/DnrJ/EryC1/StrS family aminotransferase [Stellaceae bacterium]
MSAHIPVASPWITAHEIERVAEAAATAWRERSYYYQGAFEKAFAEHLGRRHALALPSCTSGLHLALAGLGIGPGDEVVVPEITWIATSAPVSYVGAAPVFADIDPEHWCLTPASVEAVLTPRSRAVIVVDLYGDMPDWNGLLNLARRRGLALIEDAAEAIGASYRGRRAGSLGAASAFSFHGSKTLTTGEGGMLLYDDDHLHDRCLRLRDHGRAPGDIMFRNEEIGFKYRMSGLQAALGLAQFERLDELVARKREIFARYREALAGVDGLQLNRTAAHVENGYWMVTAILDPALGWTKERLIPAMKAEGIDTRPFFYPLSWLKAYRETEAGRQAAARNAVAYRLSPYGINLPSGPDLDHASIARVAETLARLIRHRPAASGLA